MVRSTTWLWRDAGGDGTQLSVPVIAALGGVVFLSEALGMRLIDSTVVILGGVGMTVFSRATPLNQSAGLFDIVKTYFKE
jgi:hypothetical protein